MEFQMGLGIVLVLALIVGVGVWSGRRVKNETDFLTGGGQAGPALVCKGPSLPGPWVCLSRCPRRPNPHPP